MLRDIPRTIRAQAPETPLSPHATVVVHEAEGTRVIESIADHTPSMSEPQWAEITLAVEFRIEAIDLLAPVSTALAAASVPRNVAAVMHHDHLFVPWAQREAAVSALRKRVAH